MEYLQINMNTLVKILERSETQAVIFGTFSVMGAWVFLCWLTKLLVSLLWPLTALCIFMILMIPPWRSLINEYLLADGHIFESCVKNILVGLNKTLCAH